MDLLKLLRRASVLPDSPDTQIDSSIRPTWPQRVEDEYREIIWTQLERAEISRQTVTLELLKAGVTAGDGRQVFLGMLRLAEWDRTTGVRLLLGLPFLEAKVQRAVRATWLPEVCHFGGLWLHASGELRASAALTDLRSCIQHLEALQGTPSSDSIWSAPAALDSQSGGSVV